MSINHLSKYCFQNITNEGHGHVITHDYSVGPVDKDTFVIDISP